MFGFEKIAEERINAALKNGAFDNLEGAGKPLPKEDLNIPEDLRLAYRILKNANFTPPELELKKDIKTTEELLISMEDTKEKYKVLKKVNHMITKYNILHGRSLMSDLPQHYQEKIVNVFGQGNAEAKK